MSEPKFKINTSVFRNNREEKHRSGKVPITNIAATTASSSAAQMNSITSHIVVALILNELKMLMLLYAQRVVNHCHHSIEIPSFYRTFPSILLIIQQKIELFSLSAAKYRPLQSPKLCYNRFIDVGVAIICDISQGNQQHQLN